jgi:protein O-GlcNAc transferase
LYNRIDIALDTYPYNGHTTTLDGLWMGVPAITRAGATHVSRLGLALCRLLKLDDLAGMAGTSGETRPRRDPTRLGFAAETCAKAHPTLHPPRHPKQYPPRYPIRLAVGSEGEYEAAAVALASDLPRLAALRAGLRERRGQSPLCGGGRHARAVEAVYRDLWRKWCGGGVGCGHL